MEYELKQIWDNLMKISHVALNMNVGDYYDIFNNVIVKNYSKKDRYYHNPHHVMDMIEHLEKDFIKYLSASDRCLVKFAIFFHDVIYDATRKDNEKQSAALAYNKMKEMGIDDNYCQNVYDMILKTQYHLNLEPTNELEKILVDLDLRGFGTDKYWDNGDKFRWEFSHLDDETWFKGRINFLENFLEKQHIFNTALYRTKYEEKAIEYMKNELNQLKEKYE